MLTFIGNDWVISDRVLDSYCDIDQSPMSTSKSKANLRAGQCDPVVVGVASTVMERDRKFSTLVINYIKSGLDSPPFRRSRQR